MITEEFNGFVQYIAQILGLPQPVLVVVAFAAGIGWICWRTTILAHRAHPDLADRLWSGYANR